MVSIFTEAFSIRKLLESQKKRFGLALEDFEDRIKSETHGIFALAAGEKADFGVAFRFGKKFFIQAETERAAVELLQKGLQWEYDVDIFSPQSWIKSRAEDFLTKLKSKPPGTGDKPRGSRIESQKDPLLDFVRTLQSEKARKESGFCVAHGVLLAERAMSAYAPIGAMIFIDRFAQGEGQHLSKRADEAGISWHVISDGLMRKCVDSAYVPPVLTILRRNTVEKAQLHIGERFLAVAGENIEEHGNLGMIIRTADAVAADVVLVKNCDAFHWRSITGSRGSVFRVPICEIEDFDFPPMDCLRKIAAATGTPNSYSDFTYLGATLFIVGNESEGLSEEALNAASERVTIPMPGGTDSLNVAVSASVLLYEALRQRQLAKL